MSMERLSQQVDAYVAWKRELMREITRYRSWLEQNRLNSDAVQAKLERALKILRTDHITLAFVGEFSRGKTELINSLFFSEYGQRMLPSHAGRTTMCPTELFFDPRSERPYIRLLPIETRTASASVAQFKRIPRHWVNIPLDTSDPANMALAFSQVAKTKPMPVEQAIQLANREILSQRLPPITKENLLPLAVSVARLRSQYLAEAFRIAGSIDSRGPQDYRFHRVALKAFDQRLGFVFGLLVIIRGRDRRVFVSGRIGNISMDATGAAIHKTAHPGCSR